MAGKRAEPGDCRPVWPSGRISYLEQVHSLLQKPLWEQNVANPDHATGIRKRVYLVESFLCDTGLVRIMEDSCLGIVGDNLRGSKRLFLPC